MLSQIIFISVGLLSFNGLLGSSTNPLGPYAPIVFIVSLIALILTVIDLYKRQFTNSNSKITWLLVLALTGGIGWVFYIFKHAIKPRNVIQNV